MENIYDIIKERCNNVGHSCKIDDLLKETGLTKLELWQALQSSPFSWEIGININKQKLLVLL